MVQQRNDGSLDHRVEVVRTRSEEMNDISDELVVGVYLKRKNQGCILSFCPEQLGEWEVAIY